MNKMKNWNCSSDRCREQHGEVRVYPLGGGANLILCRACWEYENRYRRERDQQNRYCRERDQPDKWPQHDWLKCEIYGEGAK